MKFLAVDFFALGVPSGLFESLYHGIDHRFGIGYGVIKKFPDQGVQAGASGFCIAPATLEEVVGNGEGHVRHAHRICAKAVLSIFQRDLWFMRNVDKIRFMSRLSKRNPWIIGCVVLFFVGIPVALHFLEGPLDLSKEEEPFRSIAMPPQAVYGTGYMDGGSVGIHIVDHLGKHHDVCFPIDYDGIRNPYPTAFHGEINNRAKVPLKNPERAKELCIRLIDEYGKEWNDPEVGINNETARARRALASAPHVVAVRAFDKAKREVGF
ncbi:MAG: hypothetical protein MUF13_10625 [Akkermansiaceae bacterium]|nr:hypothetical protein [Akkermansiaceae bacterium]